jgi:hypothetical protein
MEDMIRETFDPRYIATVQGGKDVNQILFSLLTSRVERRASLKQDWNQYKE